MTQGTQQNANYQTSLKLFWKENIQPVWDFFSKIEDSTGLRYLFTLVVLIATTIIIRFDYAFFEKEVTNLLPFSSGYEQFYALVACFAVVWGFKLSFAALVKLFIVYSSSHQATFSQYARQFVGLILSLGFWTAIALYGSHNGHLNVVKQNIVYQKLPDNQDLQAAKDSLGSSQQYYTRMIAKEQQKLDDYEIKLSKDSWNPAYKNLTTAAAKQKEVWINAKLEQADFWQERIEKIENRYYEEVAKVKQANAALQTDTVASAKALSVWVYGLIVFLSFLTILIYYSPSPTLTEGAAQNSNGVDYQQVANIANHVASVANVANVANSFKELHQRRVKITHIKGKGYAKLDDESYFLQYAQLIQLLKDFRESGHKDPSKWNCQSLDKNIINTEGGTMESRNGNFIKEFWLHHTNHRAAVLKGKREEEADGTGGQGV